jgi:hypothetical protein
MTQDEQRGRARHRLVLATAALLVLAGAIVVGVGLHGQRHAPQPPAVAPSPVAARTPSTTPSAPATRGPVLGAATPTTLSIPSIGVTSTLLQLGLNADHTTQVPPQRRNGQAGWLRASPAPGQLGPAIILGHVDSAQYGPGVFFKLGALRPGATITIGRADHTVAVFRLDRLVSYPKDHFPTLDVYGNTDHAALRLITCGGKFNLSRHSYESNVVAYASLVSSHPVSNRQA